MRNPFKSKDSKPLMLSFLWQKDDCSRVTGYFVEHRQQFTTKEVILSVDGITSPDDEPEDVFIDIGGTDKEGAVKILVKALVKLGGC